jgi:hypothetical protein
VCGIRGQKGDLSISPVEFSKDASLVSQLSVIGPLLGRDLGTNNVTTAFVTQRRDKHPSTTIALLLGMVFSIRSVQMSYLEDNWGDPVC